MLTSCSSAVNFSFPFCFAACAHALARCARFPRHGVRCELGSGVFSLVSGLPSTTSAGRLPAFVRLASPVLRRCTTPRRVHGGLMAHRLLLPDRLLLRAATGSPGSRAWSFSACLGSWRKNLKAHFDSAGLRLTRVIVTAPMLPSERADAVASRNP